MKASIITDSNYPTIESLANSAGKLNTAIVKSPEFSKLCVCRELLDKTSELNVFDGIEFKHRFEFYMLGMSLQFCKTCGKPFVEFKRSQKRFSLCKHHHTGADFGDTLRKAKNEKLKVFLSELSDHRLRLAETDYKLKVKALMSQPRNYAFIVTKSGYSDFYHDLILKTANILEVKEEDLMISRRLYLEYNGMKSEPLCSYCGKNHVAFVNRLKGYSDSCAECSQLKSFETRGANTKAAIDSAIDFNKYEVVAYPKLVNRDPLVIRCRSCGETTSLSIKNGKIENLASGGLCNHCEHKVGWEETEFYEFLKTVYAGTIVHGIGGRKVIPPFELDNYMPEKKLAFEYDGIYRHSEDNGKDCAYHVKKTDMCEKHGIHLIHIFSSEWKFCRDIVEARIKNMLGLYDKVVYARNCELKIVSPGESREFQNANHIQGSANASVNIGLYSDDVLVSLMTFGRCRFSKKYEWELVRFCNRLGYHIPGAASKMLKHFERGWNPKSLISYADRRWSRGQLYCALGFSLSHISPPNYWYFKKGSGRIFSRMRFQKHKLPKLLESFDASKSEVENMRMNGYSRIFDCGNMVFVKECR